MKSATYTLDVIFRALCCLNMPDANIHSSFFNKNWRRWDQKLGHFLSTFGHRTGVNSALSFEIASSEDRENTILCLISVFSLIFFASALIKSSTL